MGGGRFSIQAVSTVSIQGDRPVQEDHVLASKDKSIFVVADGFGGAGPGARAAKVACEAVKGFLEKEAGDDEATLPYVIRSYFSLAGNVLFNALLVANRKVMAQNKGKGVHERGGASVLAGYFDGDLLALANVGSCSAWLFRGGRCRELVTPRTYARLCDPMRMDPSPGLQIPLMAMGMVEDLEPEVTEYRLSPGDWLLLHTDGLSHEAREGLIAIQQKQLRNSQAAEEASACLKRSQTHDNLAASLIIL